MHPPAKVKILLVDDHVMTRNGLRQALETQEGYYVVGDAATGAKALQQVEALQPDLVVMDLLLPDTNGMEVSRGILGAHPAIKIMMYSSEISRAKIDEALELGACGYLSKESSLEELLRAVETVMAGRLYLSPAASGDILKDYQAGLREKTRERATLISEHEKDLLRLISSGLRNKEIATELGVSAKSVEAYRSRLMKKLGCSSPAELVLYAVREGITRV